MQGFLAPNVIVFHLVLVSSPSKKTHNDRSAALTPALTLNTCFSRFHIREQEKH